MSPEFCLRWNNHQSNLVNVFKDLLQTGELVDVTLSAGGEFIHAHRVMLSACSLYFKELFAVNPNHHPIVILKDFHIEDLKTVVDFIYQGEVNVAQERLPHVLKAAETLRIKGLAENPRNYEEFQTSVNQDIPRLGSQSTGSSFSDSRDQGIEVSDDAGAERTTPPHKRRRTNFDTEESKRVIVKEEEPSNSNTNEENRQSEEETNQTCLVRESSSLLQSLSPSTAEERASPTHSPTPPPSLPPTPSLTNNGDAEGGALPGLITHGQGSGNWTLPLTPWWASVLPALARQHQQNSLNQSRGGFLHPPTPTTPPTPPLSTNTLLNKIKIERGRSCWPGGSRENSPIIGRQWNNDGFAGGRESTPQPPIPGLDQLSLVTALGKEVSPQMVMALQAVAARRESFSSAAKLYNVSVTTLWRYFKKLNLADARKEAAAAAASKPINATSCIPTTFIP